MRVAESKKERERQEEGGRGRRITGFCVCATPECATRRTHGMEREKKRAINNIRKRAKMKSNGTNITETKTTRNEAPKQKRGGGGARRFRKKRHSTGYKSELREIQ